MLPVWDVGDGPIVLGGALKLTDGEKLDFHISRLKNNIESSARLELSKLRDHVKLLREALNQLQCGCLGGLVEGHVERTHCCIRCRALELTDAT